MTEKPPPSVDPKELARLAESLGKLTKDYEHVREASREQDPAQSGRPH